MENQNSPSREEQKAKLERIGCAVLAGLSVVVAVYCHHQMKKSVRLLDKAADSVADLTVVNIRDGIVNQAMERAANREVGRAVAEAVRSVEGTIADETQRRVREAVRQNYGKLQKTVAENIAREAAKVDRGEIMKAATEQAKELIVQKFDGKLDDLLADYNRNLDNVGKIYQSIAESMTNKAGKEVSFKLG